MRALRTLLIGGAQHRVRVPWPVGFPHWLWFSRGIICEWEKGFATSYHHTSMHEFLSALLFIFQMVVLRSGKVLKEPVTLRITTDVPVYGRVMRQRGRQTRATMRRGPDRFDEPLNHVPLPVAPASPSMPPLDPPIGHLQPGPLPRLSTEVPSRYHREDDMTCDCRNYPSLSLLGYTPLCIHRMIDPLSPRYAQYLPQDYTMHEGERGSDAMRLRYPLERCDPTHAPHIAIYKGEPEDDDTDSDLELTAWTSNRVPLSQQLLNPPFTIQNR